MDGPVTDSRPPYHLAYLVDVRGQWRAYIGVDPVCPLHGHVGNLAEDFSYIGLGIPFDSLAFERPEGVWWFGHWVDLNLQDLQAHMEDQLDKMREVCYTLLVDQLGL